MRSVVLFILASIMVCILVCASPAPLLAQGTNLPKVDMVIDNYEYMISLFPDDYNSRRDALRACSTIVPQAETLKAFWQEQGDVILYYLSYYAGIDWVEHDFDIYIVKYYPDYANYDPLTIPLAGKKNGKQIIALPNGLSVYITLFQQLAKRLLNQTQYPGATPYFIAGHPLMQKTDRRFDNLANLLALRTLSDFANIDSIMTVFKSQHWKDREPGQEVLFKYFWDKWNLSADSTLAAYIANEPYGSRLVALTRPPVTSKPQASSWGDHQLQAPPAGRLGFSVAKDRSGFYKVVEIDNLKLAWVSGLRPNDLIRNVDGTAPRTIKQLYEMILAKLDRGAHLNIVRNDEPEAVIIYPWTNLPSSDERYNPIDMFPQSDSTDSQ